jgi:hypothetical protein
MEVVGCIRPVKAIGVLPMVKSKSVPLKVSGVFAAPAGASAAKRRGDSKPSDAAPAITPDA